MATVQPKATYRVTPLWIVAYFITFTSIMAVFFTRSASFWNTTPAIGALHIGQHASNFAISYIIVMAAGLLGLVIDGSRAMRRISIIAGLAILANLVYELFIPFINTRDMLDALYGILGTIFAIGLLWLIQRFGLRPLTNRK